MPLNPPPSLPVAVVGAGPVGLAAAAHLVAKGDTPLVFEAGGTAGASVREWAHVRLFSPWKYLTDPMARGLLEASGWKCPDPELLPTGGEFLDHFVDPLARLPSIRPHLRLGHRVLAVTRRGMDKVQTAGRDAAPFELVVREPGGGMKRFLARAVIDASGTWRSPNPVGAGGVPAAGEADHQSRIIYGIPDILGGERDRYAGRRTLVVGSGHSAFHALLDLAGLAAGARGTEIVWAVRRSELGLLFGGGPKDALAARGALGTRLQRLVTAKQIEFVTGFRVARIEAVGEGLAVEGVDGRRLEGLDQLIAATGFRPDLELTRELRLELDPWLEAPKALAPSIDPNLHSCGTVYPHGATELAHPERDFYVAGMKSYGRAPTFLLLTGYEQVRSVVSRLIGDEEGARRVELALPETGVCRTDLAAGSCCGAADEAELAGIERSPTAGGCGCGTAPAVARLPIASLERCCGQ
ncbi:MAG: FAD-dependent oxidoreductase [Gemmatimonadales bacterium]|nr:FAD-dependent oxidoreductase [Gemmatimonadales bacterium]